MVQLSTASDALSKNLINRQLKPILDKAILAGMPASVFGKPSVFFGNACNPASPLLTLFSNFQRAIPTPMFLNISLICPRILWTTLSWSGLLLSWLFAPSSTGMIWERGLPSQSTLAATLKQTLSMGPLPSLILRRILLLPAIALLLFAAFKISSS